MANDFSKGSVEKNIMMQAIPMTVAQLIQILYNIVDRIYIGHLPGSDGLALTGVGIVFPIVSLITAFANLFGIGGSPLCAIARGAGENEKSEKILGVSAWLVSVASVAIMALCLLFENPILYLFGASPETYPYAREYMMIYLTGTVFFMVGSGLNYFISAQGFPKIGMMTTLIGAVLNIILDPVFIFALNMGVAGAAVATVISQAVSFVWVLRFLTGKEAVMPLRRRNFHFDPAIAKNIIALGLSGFIMSATNGLVQAVCNVMLGVYGGDLYIGVITIINSIRDFLCIPGQGIAHGSKPVLGFNYGAGKYARLKRGIIFMTMISSAYMLVTWVITMIFPGQMIRIFTTEQNVIEAGIPALRVYFAGFLFQNFQFCGQSVFQGLGKSKQAIFFSIFRKVIIVVPLTLLLPKVAGLGVYGVFLAEPVSNIVGGLACYITMVMTLLRKLPDTDR